MTLRILLTIFVCITATPLFGQGEASRVERSHGGIIRGDTSQRIIALVFTGHEFADGGQIIRATLKRRQILASFFFTGDFYRNPEFAPLIRNLIRDGHYLGGHSNKHLLYASWENRDSMLVTRDGFIHDFRANYAEMTRFGIRQNSARFFLPPYEWYNDSISRWCAEAGKVLVNFTPGTYSNADWTYPELGKQYISSDTIFARILDFEKNRKNGLNGFILLFHIGVDPRRPDKFCEKLGMLIDSLFSRGYKFLRIDQLIR